MELQYDEVNQPSYRLHLHQGPQKDSAAERAETKSREGPLNCQAAGWQPGQAQSSLCFPDQECGGQPERR